MTIEITYQWYLMICAWIKGPKMVPRDRKAGQTGRKGGRPSEQKKTPSEVQ